MKFSESWLREWVNPDISTDALVAQLTMAGLEVDAVEPVAGSFSGVVVGEIVSIAAHPDAEKLRVCQVAGVDDVPLQVVCGAPNARKGIKVPFATLGAQLPGDFKIKKAKLRGVESFGMLCAQTELEAGDDDDGLWELPLDAPVGEDLRKYLQLDDRVIEVDLTPNRGDCLSIRGLAREVGVLTATAVDVPTEKAIAPSHDETFPVHIQAASACLSYAGRVIKGVDISQPSPLWMVEKLRRSGIRSIDPVVDVTNYVLLELGQPMHAFDLARLKGGIEVRLSGQGESLTLLDGKEIQLQPETLVIADGNGAAAIAGIMGGKRTAVDATTQDIFLESAFFTPEALSGKARSYGLHTDSSHRFERGVDRQLQTCAIERATELLMAIAGGQPGPVIAERARAASESAPLVELRKERLSRLLGVRLDHAQVEEALGRLGLTLQDQSDQRWLFAIPSHRFDLAIEEDLIEEVARIVGYDNLPTRATPFSLALPTMSERKSSLSSLKGHLVTRGFQEVVTYSFIDPELSQHFDTGHTPVALQNPISSEMSVMRTSLVPGLIGVLKTNLNRQKTRVQCFEEGMRFCSKKGETSDLVQERAVAGLLYGAGKAGSWFAKSVDADFYDIKGHVESLVSQLCGNVSLSFEACDGLAFMHPGQTAWVCVEGERIGYIGSLHPKIQKVLGLGKPPLVFELKSAPLLQRELPKYEGLSRFPEVSRDLAVLVNNSAAYSELESAIRESGGNCLTNLKLFDVYRGEGIDPERKSLAFSLTFQHPSRTLSDEEVNAAMAAVVTRLEDGFGATLR